MVVQPNMDADPKLVPNPDPILSTWNWIRNYVIGFVSKSVQIRIRTHHLQNGSEFKHNMISDRTQPICIHLTQENDSGFSNSKFSLDNNGK